jgi:hypothetical protein
MERSGRARRLTGSPWAQPGHSALQCLSYCVSERVGACRLFALILARCLDAHSGSFGCGSRRARFPWLPLTRSWYSLVNGHRSATPLNRTVRGHRYVSRSQSATQTSLCNRCLDSDGTSIRVWCRHALSASAFGNEVSAWYQTSTSPHERSPPKSGKISAHRASLPLDNRGPHKCSAQ